MAQYKPLAWFTMAFLVVFALGANGLYFYLEEGEEKCFMEDLPKDTLVVGVYKAEVWSQTQQKFIEDASLGIDIKIEEQDDDHHLSFIKGAHAGRFTFTTTDSVEHYVCLSTNTSSWWNTERVRLHLDLTLADPIHKDDQDSHNDNLGALYEALQELNARVLEAHREQSYLRVRETHFRDMSERANNRVVWWSLSQIGVLIMTMTWQLRHLRSFFIKRKLV
ncbi:uncharacterized protein VTP21DRAFT_6044 [Calcarisporiella thermophila]|uniref:uncharacterized protein n=1 Tax=Calcarisporiella thermophila TaxID=911321 RepID=UPI003742954E